MAACAGHPAGQSTHRPGIFKVNNRELTALIIWVLHPVVLFDPGLASSEKIALVAVLACYLKNGESLAAGKAGYPLPVAAMTGSLVLDIV